MFNQKEYMKRYNKKYYKKNREKAIEYSNRYREKNHERLIKQSRQRRNDNPEKIKEYNKKYLKNNPEKRKGTIKKYCENNLEKVKESGRKWYKNNTKKVRKYHAEWMNLKYKTDLKFNLSSKISNMMRQSLKRNKNGQPWETLLNYTLIDLIKRLDKTMPAGYTWEDYLSGRLHIDHIIPIDAFNFTRPEHTDFKRCWVLSNLRLLPAKENLIKGDKLDRPFQPALKI